MAFSTSFVFNLGAYQLATGVASWTAASTIKARLVASDITAGAGYYDRDTVNMSNFSAIGAADQTLTGCAVSTDYTNDRVTYTANSCLWSSVAAGGTVGGVVIYRYVAASDASNIPIAGVDLVDTPTNGGNITVTWHANGCFYLQE